MAGFLGFFNDSKTGPGVEKNAPKKKQIIVFFEIYFRKLWKTCILNFMYCIALIPLFVLIFWLYRLLLSTGIYSGLALMAALFPCAFLGPFSAGITRVTRDFSREIPVFIWGDFKETVRKNWKDSLIVSLIQYVVFVVLIVALLFYYSLIPQGMLYYIPFLVCLFMTAVFLFSSYYLYVMLISVRLSMKQLWKNCISFAVIGIWRNLLITLVGGGLLALLGVLVVYGLAGQALMLFIAFLFILFFIFSFLSYLVNFLVYPLIQKHVIDPYYENSEKENGEKAPIGPSNLQSQHSDSPTPASEYVYQDGKMVHRSVLESEPLFDDNDSVNRKHKS